MNLKKVWNNTGQFEHSCKQQFETVMAAILLTVGLVIALTAVLHGIWGWYHIIFGGLDLKDVPAYYKFQHAFIQSGVVIDVIGVTIGSLVLAYHTPIKMCMLYKSWKRYG